MSLDVASLADDAALLKALLVEVDADRNAHKLLYQRLKLQLAKLRRLQFGTSSEKLAHKVQQLELALEEAEAKAAAAWTARPTHLKGLRAWLEATLPKLSRKSDLAVATRYALSRWRALERQIDDGRLEIDNNATERALRGEALGREN